MLRAVHELPCNQIKIVEINVWKILPGFVALRNRVDDELLVDSIKVGRAMAATTGYLEGDRFPTLAGTRGIVQPRWDALHPVKCRSPYELYKLDRNYHVMAMKSSIDYGGEAFVKHHRGVDRDAAKQVGRLIGPNVARSTGRVQGNLEEEVDLPTRVY
jgi:hypothetical protein